MDGTNFGGRLLVLLGLVLGAGIDLIRAGVVQDDDAVVIARVTSDVALSLESEFIYFLHTAAKALGR